MDVTVDHPGYHRQSGGVDYRSAGRDVPIGVDRCDPPFINLNGGVADWVTPVPIDEQSTVDYGSHCQEPPDERARRRLYQAHRQSAATGTRRILGMAADAGTRSVGAWDTGGIPGLERKPGSPADVCSGATFDPTRSYRYLLWRRWDVTLPEVAFVMLNPSTADETDDDPTIRRCAGFARAWGFGGIVVANLFAFRSASPLALRSCPDPVGPENNRYLCAVRERTNSVIAAWGQHGALFGRSAQVRGLLEAGGPLSVLRLNAGGEPAHPLYLPGSLRPVPWSGGSGAS